MRARRVILRMREPLSHIGQALKSGDMERKGVLARVTKIAQAATLTLFKRGKRRFFLKMVRSLQRKHQ